MGTIKALIVVALFAVVGGIGNQVIENEEISELVTEQKKLYQTLKAQNKRFSWMLDEILNRLDKNQDSYKEMEKFRSLARNAEGLIAEIEKLIATIPAERDIGVLLFNLSEIETKCAEVSLIHRLLDSVLRAIFAPWPKKPPPEIIVRAFEPPHSLWVRLSF